MVLSAVRVVFHRVGNVKFVVSYDASSMLRKQVARLPLRIGHYPRGLVMYASDQATLLEL